MRKVLTILLIFFGLILVVPAFAGWWVWNTYPLTDLQAGQGDTVFLPTLRNSDDFLCFLKVSNGSTVKIAWTLAVKPRRGSSYVSFSGADSILSTGWKVCSLATHHTVLPRVLSLADTALFIWQSAEASDAMGCTLQIYLKNYAR